MLSFVLITNSLLKETEDRVRKTDPHDFKLMRGKIELSEQFSAKLDTLKGLLQQADKDSMQIDSLFKRVDFQRVFPVTNDSFTAATIPGLPEFTIKSWDWYMLSADSIIQKYQYHSWIEKRALQQAQKSRELKTGMLKFYISMFAFSTLLLVAMYAGVLYFFYRKQGWYYVEHFVFLLHVTTALMLFLTVFIVLVNYFMDNPPLVNVLVGIGGPLLYSFYAQRNFYGASLRSTFWKWLVGTIIAITLFVGLFLAGMTLSFLLF